MKIRNEVLWFAEQMEKKLKKNDNKPHWLDSSPDYLLERLCDEVKELMQARQHGKSPTFVIKECADVANFAMMIADMCNQKEST